MSTLSPSLAEVLERVLDSRLAMVRTCFPATVVTYDRATQTARLRPAVKAAVPRFDNPDLDEIETLPDLPEVPVTWPGGGSSFLACDLVPGDAVVVICADTNWDAWWTTGAAGAPEDGRTHDPSFAFCIPCVRRPGQQIAGLTGPMLQLGGSSDSVALASVLDNLISLFKAWSPVSGDGGGALKSAFDAAFHAWAGDPAPTIAITSASTRIKVDE